MRRKLLRKVIDWDTWVGKHYWWFEFDYLSLGLGWRFEIVPPDGYHAYHSTEIELWLLFLKVGYAFSEPGEYTP